MFGLDIETARSLVDQLLALSTFRKALIVAAVAFLFLAIQTLRSRKALRLPRIKSDKKTGVLFKNSGLKMFTWLNQLFGDIATLFTQSEDLYKTPWILILGEEKSGIPSLASSLQKSNKFTSLLRESPLVRQKQGWWPFDSGMLIDLQGLINKSSRKDVVDEFMKLRPERPFDGVVVCISAEDLAGATPKQLTDRSLAIHDQLTQLQQDFAFTFPVYVCITKSDLIPGFSEFWRAQDKESFDKRREEIFGWSNPGSLESGYSDSWIVDAFRNMQDSLRVEQLRVSADGTESSQSELDNFFVFPTKFQALQSSITDLFSRIFTVNAYQANFFLRGLYFTGKVIDDVDGSLEQGALDETRVSFAEQLFSMKVFAERHLARPVREGIWSRQVQIKRLQKIMLGLGAFFILALIVSSFSIKSRVNSIDLVLNRVSYESNNSNFGGGQSCTDPEVITDTLGSLNSLNSGVSSLFMPVSLFATGLEHRIFDFVSDSAVTDLVIKAMDCRIKEREKGLVANNLSVGVASLSSIELLESRSISVESYLQQVIERQQILSYWNESLAHGDGKEKYKALRHIYELLYQENFPAKVHKNRSVLIDILQRTRISEYSTDDAVNVKIIANIEKNLTDLDVLTDAALNSGSYVVEQYNQTNNLTVSQISFLANWIDWIDKEWLPAPMFESMTECQQLVDRFKDELSEIDGYSSLDDSNSQKTYAERFNPSDCRNRAKKALIKVATAPLGNMLGYNSSPTAALATVENNAKTPQTSDSLIVMDAWKDEAKQLSELSRLSFMQLPGGEFSCESGTVRWDNTILKQMLQRMAELENYEALSVSATSVTSAIVDGIEYPHERLAKYHLARILNELALTAQTDSYSSPVYNTSSMAVPTMASLRQGSQDFVQSGANLATIIQKYQSLGMSDEGAPLALCTQNFAVSQLKSLGARANLSGVLMPDENTNAYENETTNLLDFDGVNDLDDWWTLSFTAAKNIAGYGSSFVDFLNNSKDIYGLNGGQTAIAYYWNNNVSETNEFEAGTNTAQVGHLKSLFGDMADLNSQNCPGIIDKLPTEDLGVDLYSDRRQKYSKLAKTFCQSEIEVAGSKVMTDLNTKFGQLASRFPFAKASVSAEASLNNTRYFFLDYASVSDEIEAYLSETGNKANIASNKLLVNQFNDGVQFFNSHLAVEGSPAALDLGVIFRPNQDSSNGSDGSQDVMLWALTNGVQTVKRPPGQNSLSWFYGQPLTFTFTWATNGNIAPETDPAQPGLSVDEATKTATFSFTGTWALQRLIAEHWDSGPATGSTEPKTVRLKFEIPVKTVASKKSKKADKPATSNPLPNVALYVDLNITTTGSAGQSTPVFVPQQLPQTFPK